MDPSAKNKRLLALKPQVETWAHAFHADTVNVRRTLHQNPELSFEEQETAAFLSDALTNYGIPFEAGIAGHGIIAYIRGQAPGSSRRCLALRADMDALPIQEAGDASYKSRRPGIMHACGHDAHTASMLGAARILHQLRHTFTGVVKVLFQPAEEKLPGGASLMIQAGALRSPKPQGIVGQHVYPSLEAGKVGFRAGMYMASADEIYLRVHGRGGHGAMPHEGVDPVALSAQILTALQQVVSRAANPLIPSVLTFGKINSIGGATNIIPSEVRLEGTFRTMDERWRTEAHKRIRNMAENIAQSMGGACTVEIRKGYPALYNHEGLTARVRTAAETLLGADKVTELPMRMTAEDFAWYTHKIPGCFYRLGTGNPAKGIVSPVHTDTFDIDEDALYVGAALPAWFALTELT